jgi:predicted solute-binding protein
VRDFLRVGCVEYLNARPLIRGWAGEVLLDNPASLCARLARADLDLAFVSSFEFLRNPIYRIVDDVSISSAGPVYSVFVAHSGTVPEIEEIEIDPAAETSVNLLRCLLGEWRLAPRFTPVTTATVTRRHARLLIGDQALRFRNKHENELEFWDLGDQWTRLVGLPFVYALWLIRPEVLQPNGIADRLRGLRDQNLADIDKLVAEETEFNPDFCRRYYRDNLRFTFAESEKQGLRKFQALCEKHGLLSKRELTFSLV